MLDTLEQSAAAAPISNVNPHILAIEEGLLGGRSLIHSTRRIIDGLSVEDLRQMPVAVSDTYIACAAMVHEIANKLGMKTVDIPYLSRDLAFAEYRKR